MFSGPPLPLPPELPLSFLFSHARLPGTLGAWVRRAKCDSRLYDTSGPAGRPVLLSADLGFLLARCDRIALREGSGPVILDADTVIRWRALQVITALPHLPGLERLIKEFPGITHCGSLGLLIPIPTESPEEVLAACLATGMQVTGSRVVYSSPPHPAGQPFGQ
jgi:hypothetical protein